jgi:hypothetical protein
MSVTASVNWNTSNHGEFTLQKLFPFPWDDNVTNVAETDINKIEIEVATKNMLVWDRIDALMNKDKTDC